MYSYTYVYTFIYIYIQIHEVYIYSYVYRQSGHRGESIDRVAQPEAHVLGFKILVQPPLGSLHPQKKREKEKKYQTQESHVNRYRDSHTWFQDIRVIPTWIHALPKKRRDKRKMINTQRNRMLQCVAAYCSVLQCVAECCSVMQSVAVCCHVLPCVAVSVAVCCSVMQCVAVRYLAAKSTLSNAFKRQDICLHMPVLQCVAVYCSVVQCIAVRCSALQCVTSRPSPDSLTPPKGAISLEIMPSFTPTIPYSSPCFVEVCCSMLQCASVYCSVIQCVSVCCSLLQCVAVCCKVSQWVSVCCIV